MPFPTSVNVSLFHYILLPVIFSLDSCCYFFYINLDWCWIVFRCASGEASVGCALSMSISTAWVRECNLGYLSLIALGTFQAHCLLSPHITSIISTASIFTSSIFYLSLINVVHNLASVRMHKVIKIHRALMWGVLLHKLQSSKFMSCCYSMTPQHQSPSFISFQ